MHSARLHTIPASRTGLRTHVPQPGCQLGADCVLCDGRPVSILGEAMVYVLAVAAALSNALTSVFQRMGVEDAPEESTMRLSLMAHAIRRGVWLLGFGFMICSFLLQSFALHIGRLSVVQPILTMELLFLVAILGTYFRFSISIREWVGAGGHRLRARPASSYFAAPGRRRRGADQPRVDRGRRRAAASLIVVTVVPTRWGPVGGRRPCSAARPPSPIAFTAALIKTVSDYAANDWVTMFVALADLRRHRLRAARPLPDAERVPRRAAGRLAVDPGPGRPARQHLPRDRPLRRQPADLGPLRPARGPLAPA